MTLKQLRYVTVVADTGSITEAARQLYIAQPSLTSAIRELENEYGIVIFKRSKKGIEVTPEGEEFLGYARQVLEQTDLIDERYTGSNRGKLRFCVSSQHYSFVVEAFVKLLKEYGGELIEFPYSANEEYKKIEAHSVEQLSIPDARRGRLRKLLGMNKLVTAMEAHSGITGLIVEKTTVYKDGKASSFDAMWISSLCDSTAKGKPDIELVDMTSRFRTIDDIMEVTTKPIIFDGDTGGLAEHFVYTVRSLERMGVSMIIIEDKTGLKKNSLFGTEVKQTQDSIENFSAKIRAGKKAQKTKDFMICARIESLILERGMEDALERAHAFTAAGADAIMIHSRKKDPAEIKEFIEKFRQQDKITPIVLVPTSFNTVYEEEWKELGANIIIYANQLTRTGFPAMQDAAKTILENHRAKECDDKCMSIKEIITLIPEE